MHFKLGEKPHEYLDKVKRELMLAQTVVDIYKRDFGNNIEWDNIIDIDYHIGQLIILIEKEKRQAYEMKDFM